ncbi:hypothetical protein N7468_005361 [Penicillium chermesinum]|uniref:Zn(2)-C6 fungal-type domain-containing protein n=1 Tax=Penicillium chermesinum TaxID=63820 RepID=A0A9W9TMX1_9EURO|nr:uncharacterized protein N7468_005361 [Penicillium chermesinum]KAJ5232405.1 hypothetical protein N7468_005361 [Penicillium chermesinum]KAJ6172062.1 hypothetical protein N7470_001129 [Penicillium chermesinum]
MPFRGMNAEFDGSMMLETPSPSLTSPMTRRHAACLRCRRRKQRCDGQLPACANCSRAGADCLQGVTSHSLSRSRIYYLENRVKELEGYEQARGRNVSSSSESFVGNIDESTAVHRRTSPARVVERPDLSSQHVQVPESSPVTQSPPGSVPGSITRDQPIAHEVGLLSLANATDPKYLGPSSGVAFARLIYAGAPQSQGLPLSHIDTFNTSQAQRSLPPQPIEAVDLPPLAECQQYAEASFEAILFLPFLAYDDVFTLLDHVHAFNKTGSWSHDMPITIAFAQVFLVLSLGARLLETKLKSSFNSSPLLESGMRLYHPAGLNAWHLVHIIIASCLDLGLQRRVNRPRTAETEVQRKRRYIRSGVFWSAYSLDRSLTTILGRPLTLRDEAIDAEFPGMDQGFEAEMGALEWPHSGINGKENGIGPYLACIYSLRFDRIVAEIKLMLYRVSRSPSRFPWPTNMDHWQSEVEASCHSLLEEAENRQRGRHKGDAVSLSLLAVQKLQLKHHQCMMLLYRPSPQITRPSRQATEKCFNSAVEIIRTSADLHRFKNMDCTWLSAHSIFVAAVTVFYYIWAKHEGIASMVSPRCLEVLETAPQLLRSLSETWPVAKEASGKLESLISAIRDSPDLLSQQGPSNDRSQAANGTGCHGASAEDNISNNGNQTDSWSQQGAHSLVDELGILRDFFDLGWLDTVTLDPLPFPVS